MNQEEIIHDVQKRLFEMQDAEYRDFHAKLVPTMEKTKFIGIRTPMLRKFASEFGKTEESEIFLQVLPHQYYEENNLHGLLIEQIRDYDKCLEELERFLPFIDNWATCDLLALHMMKKTPGCIYPGSFSLDRIGSAVYHPVWDRYADAPLSG